MKFGDNLRKLRKLRKFSQEELAAEMQVSRQSVSKWETGESYPEMNNILQLCKLFHCQINDLVNDSIIDVDALDEEVKTNVVKFKEKQQNKMKGLSRAIMIIAKIGRIVCWIAIPCVVVAMIFSGLLANKLKIDDNKISVENESTFAIVDTGDEVSLRIHSLTIGRITDQAEVNKIKELLNNNSRITVTCYIETGFAILVLTLILMAIVLQYLENLFRNINQGDTPFTLENVDYIKKIAFLMIIITVLPSMFGGLFELVMRMDLDVDLEMFNLVEILFLFSIAYIFQYGYEIQLDSKGKMYGKENE